MPEKQADGSSITYYYANGASINYRADTGEYHVVVPNGDGGKTVSARTGNAATGYTVRTSATNANDELVFESTARQATPDGELVDMRVTTAEHLGDFQAVRTETDDDAPEQRWLEGGGATYDLDELSQLFAAASVVAGQHEAGRLGSETFRQLGDFLTDTLRADTACTPQVLTLSAILPANARGVPQADGSMQFVDGEGKLFGILRQAGDSLRLASADGTVVVNAAGQLTAYDADGTQRYTLTRTRVAEAGADAFGDDIRYADGWHVVRATVDGKTTEQVQAVGADYEARLYQGSADFLAATIRRDRPGQVIAAVSLAATWGEAKAGGDLGQAFGTLGSGLSLLSGLRALQSDDFKSQVGGVVSTLQAANAIYTHLNPNDTLFQADTLKLLQGVGAVLSLARLADLGQMIEHGQVATAAMTVVQAVNAGAYLATLGSSTSYALTGVNALIPINPMVSAALIVAAVVFDSLLSDDPEPPPSGTLTWTVANGHLVPHIVGANGGDGLLAAQAANIQAELARQLADANAGQPADEQLELVAARLPTITLQSWGAGNSGENHYFLLQARDPRTGAPQTFAAPRQSLDKNFVEALLYPEALVAAWEARHLAAHYGADTALWQTEGQWANQHSPIEAERRRLQTAADAARADVERLSQQRLNADALGRVGSAAAADPALAAARATLAAREAELTAYAQAHPADPQAAARIDARSQWLKAIAIDLGGDGIATTALPETVASDWHSLQTDGVARFDADNDGWREATEWLANTDAFLALDRNGNGAIDSAAELFNGTATAADMRGDKSLACYDDNRDGRLDASDAAFRLLRLWVDLNGDGESGAAELLDMDFAYANGVKALADRVQRIDLATLSLTLASGATLAGQALALRSRIDGLRLEQDAATGNVAVAEENGGRANYVTVVTDMTVLQELDPVTHPGTSAARRAELEALARHYGLDPAAPTFLATVRSLKAGGEQLGSHGTVLITADDTVVDAVAKGRIESARTALVRAADGEAGAGTASLAPAIWAASATRVESAILQDWHEARTVNAAELTREAPVARPAETPATATVLSPNVYTLPQVVKGAQVGGLVSQLAVVVSRSPADGAPVRETVLMAGIPGAAVVTVAAGQASLAEDSRLEFGFQQLEQEARRGVADLGPAATLRLLGVKAVSHGAVAIDDVAGRFTFTPEADYAGPAGFTYAALDERGRIVERTVNLTVTPVNDAPRVAGESAAGVEDVPLLFSAADLLANDWDVEGDAIALAGVGRVAFGKAELLPDGRLRYTPPADAYAITDTVEYLVADAAGAMRIGTITITLHAAQDAPTVLGEVIRNAREDEVVAIDPRLLLANDLDPDWDLRQGGEPLKLVAVGEAEHGRVFLDGAGTVMFVPEADFNGLARFQYSVMDSSGLVTTGWCQVDLAAVNDAPLACGESVAAAEDTVLTFEAATLLANDTDPDIARGEAQQLKIIAVGQAQHGSVQLADGQVIFTPDADYAGAASFAYTVSDGQGGFDDATVNINLAPVNDAPWMGTTTYAAVEDRAWQIRTADLLALAHDVDDPNSALRLIDVGNSAGGSVALSADRQVVTFTPFANFASRGGFEVRIADRQGAVTTGRIVLDVAGVNDAPVFLPGSYLNRTGVEDRTLRISEAALTGMFADPDGDTVRLAADSLQALNAGDTIRYDAAAREVVWTPAANQSGRRSLRFQVMDSSGARSVAQTLAVDFIPVNDTPVVGAVSFNMLEDGGANQVGWRDWSYVSLTELLKASSDADGDTLAVARVTEARTADGRAVDLRWDHWGYLGLLAPQDYAGNASLKFVVSDGHGSETTGTAYINVAPVNDLPSMTVEYLEQGPFQLYDVLRLDVTDPDNPLSSMTYGISRYPLQGSIEMNKTYGSSWWCQVDAPGYFIVRGGAGENAVTQTAELFVTDGSGGTSHLEFYFTYRWSSDPIIVDLDSDGLTFLDLEESRAAFDHDGDGVKERAAWIGPRDGILVYDYNHDDVVTQFDELEFWHHVVGGVAGMSDLSALGRAEFDSNGDGRISALDARWRDLKLWVDANSNGTVEAGEMKTLDAAGVKTLYLNPATLNRHFGENVLLRGYTRVELNDGRLLQAGDVDLGFAQPGWQPGAEMADWIGDARVVADDEAARLAARFAGEAAAAQHAGEGHFAALPANGVQKVLTGAAYRFDLPADWSGLTVTDGRGAALPAWLRFDAANRCLAGTPGLGETGDWSLQLQGRNADGQAVTLSWTLRVADTNQAPFEYGAIPTQYALEGEAFRLELAPNLFLDRDAGDALVLSATLADGSPLPAWLTFDRERLLFQGTPGMTDVTALDIRLTAADAANASASQVFKLVVENLNDAPVLAAPVPLLEWQLDRPVTLTLPAGTFRDPDGDALTYTLTAADGTALPGWLAFDGPTRSLSGTAGAADLPDWLQLRLTATDPWGAAVSTLIDLAPVRFAGTAGDDTVVGTTAWDVLYGGAGDDGIEGREGNDRLHGEAGDDTLVGGSGADILTGGTGNDVYEVDDAADSVVEAAGEGSDTVFASIAYTLPGEVENLTLTGTAIAGTGNVLDNVIIGNTGDNVLAGYVGNDRLAGGGGNDTLHGGMGADRLEGGEGDDVLDGASEAMLNIMSTGPEQFYFTGVGPASITWSTCTGSSIFTALKAGQAAALSGTSGVDKVYVGAGTRVNAVSLGGSADEIYLTGRLQDYAVTISGGAATLTRIAGLAAGQREQVVVSCAVFPNGSDKVFFTDGSLTTYAWRVAAWNKTVPVLDTTRHSDPMAAGLMVAGEGADGLVGGAGDDTYVVDDAGDIVTEQAGEGTDTVQSYLDSTVLEPHVENLQLMGARHAHGVGNALDNVLIGNCGNNVLDGGQGNDTLLGGLGNDTYVFKSGAGQDTIQENDATMGNTDVLQLSGISQTNLWFRHMGNDLQINVLGTAEQITIQDWYLPGASGADHQVERIRTADGMTMYNTDVERLVQAMASFAPPSAAQTSWTPGQTSGTGQVLLTVTH